MKPLLLIPIVMLAACASRASKPVPVVAVAPPSRSVGTSGLRSAEQIREYRFGRYVDPGDPLAMHESHPVYRIETSAGWNLRPGSSATNRPRATPEAPSISANDAVVAEVNKQRIATRSITELAARLDQRISEMKEATTQTRELAKQTALLTREVSTLRARVDASDAREREPKPAPADRSRPRTEDKW